MNARVLLPFVLLAACGGAGEPPAASPSVPPIAAPMAAPSPMGPSLVVEVVTVDTAGPSITLREGDVPPVGSPRPSDLRAGDRTIRVEAAAAASLATVKPGDRVRVTCTSLPAGTGMGAPAAASPMAGASPATAPGTMAGAVPPLAGGATAGLARCDSVVAITPLSATGM